MKKTVMILVVGSGTLFAQDREEVYMTFDTSSTNAKGR